MPLAPPRVCATCGTAGCAVHVRGPWHHQQPVSRIRGRRLQWLRRQLLESSPLCVRCLAQGRMVSATIRDHIIPLAEGGTEDPSNIQAICEPCHDAKTQREGQRGQSRSRP